MQAPIGWILGEESPRVTYLFATKPDFCQKIIYPWDKLSWYDELSKYISMLMKFRA